MGQIFKHIDWIDLLLLSCFAALGLFILKTISGALFFQQLIYWLLALVLIFAAVNLDGSLIVWFAPFGYILAIAFLVLSFFGPAIRGATRWIMIGAIQLQPSELVKPLLLLSFAWFLVKFPPKNLRNSLVNLVLFLLPFILVFKQPDLGSSLVYLSFWLAMMVAAGFPLKVFFSLITIVFLVTPFAVKTLHGYQQARIATFLNPGLDPRGAGYNALQAMIAVGSGEILGRGLGQGTQSHLRFLPEFHTDFIFATLVEELGLLGGLLLLSGYAVLLWRIISPLLQGVITEIYAFTYSVGLFAMILSQIFINSGMNMGIIPITGITLPFVSYGGSSILSLSLSFSVLWVLRNQAGRRDTIADIA